MGLCYFHGHSPYVIFYWVRNLTKKVWNSVVRENYLRVRPIKTRHVVWQNWCVHLNILLLGRIWALKRAEQHLAHWRLPVGELGGSLVFCCSLLLHQLRFFFFKHIHQVHSESRAVLQRAPRAGSCEALDPCSLLCEAEKRTVLVLQESN